MSEKLIAYSLDVVPRIVDSQNVTLLHGGGTEEPSIFVRADTHSFIQRPYDKTYIAHWNVMKKAGLPVMQDLLINPKRGFMLLTDIKSDGSEVYGKELAYCLRIPDLTPRERPRTSIDKLFLDLTDKETFPLIEQAADSLVHRANSHDIQLPSDDPMELLIHPDGTWELVILDLALARTNPVQSSFDREQRTIQNDLYKEEFLRHIKYIRGYLDK